MLESNIHLRKSILLSIRLSIYFVLVFVVITSLMEDNYKMILPKIGIGIILISAVFSINTFFIIFYERRKTKSTSKIYKKVFFSGLPFSLLFIVGFQYILHELIVLNDIPLLIEFQKEVVSNKDLLIKPTVGGVGLHYFVFLIQTFAVNQYEKNRMEQEVLKLKAINTETTNQLLQQQIQPHFLFNALNVLKALIKRHPDDAEKYLLRLSDFLRVSVSGNKSGIATVLEELKLCNDYMEMQLIRFNNSLVYQVDIAKNDAILSRKLPFFSLQPLLENAIKHNMLTEEKPLRITITSHEDYITVSNNLQPKNAMEFSTGNGLSNLQERYRLISGDKIKIAQDENEFKVSLKLI